MSSASGRNTDPNDEGNLSFLGVPGLDGNVMKEVFEGREIEVIDFSDVSSGEHVIEFRDPAWLLGEAILAIVVPDGRSWEEAAVSVNPQLDQVSVSFLTWAFGVARARID